MALITNRARIAWAVAPITLSFALVLIWWLAVPSAHKHTILWPPAFAISLAAGALASLTVKKLSRVAFYFAIFVGAALAIPIGIAVSWVFLGFYIWCSDHFGDGSAYFDEFVMVWFLYGPACLVVAPIAGGFFSAKNDDRKRA